MDLAASVQHVTEEIMLRAARHLHEQTGLTDRWLAGGVALNCVGNGRILREGPFENIWIQPAAGDAGGALGAALFTWYQLLDRPRQVSGGDAQRASLLGPAFSDDDIEACLRARGAVYHRCGDEDELIDVVTDAIASEQVVGHFHGRMEFGPRALGNRSILGDARSTAMQSVMNLKIKFRESFRPFAPIVLREHVHEWFDTRENEDSPYMLLVAPLRPERRLTAPNSQGSGLERLKSKRSDVPAVTHVDFSARVQTVDHVRHRRLHRLMRRFHDKTGCPIMINTSFNVRSEPIVCTPDDAYRCFMATGMDMLVLESFIVRKSEQPEEQPFDVEAYLGQFKLD
jgi:carbamoyltransferase